MNPGPLPVVGLGSDDGLQRKTFALAVLRVSCSLKRLAFCNVSAEQRGVNTAQQRLSKLARAQKLQSSEDFPDAICHQSLCGRLAESFPSWKQRFQNLC